jgi:hypothetical protein
MQSDLPIELSNNQNLIIALLQKAKPDFPFEIVQNDNGVPELVMEYGIVTDIPEDMDPALVVKERRKYAIPLDEQATWANVKKMVDFFEKYLKNANLYKNPTRPHDKPIA